MSLEGTELATLLRALGDNSKKVKGKGKRQSMEFSYLFRSPAHKVEITALMQASCADTFFNATHG